MVRKIDIRAAYAALREARENQHSLHMIEAQKERALKEAEAQIRAGNPGKELGGNDKERDAKVYALTEAERKACQEAQEARRAADLRLELARMDVECLQWEIRADEAAYSSLMGSVLERGLRPMRALVPLVEGGGLGR